MVLDGWGRGPLVLVDFVVLFVLFGLGLCVGFGMLLRL